MSKKQRLRTESPNLMKLIKRIWYFSVVIGAVGVMLQERFVIKETFWIISISSIVLAFSCAIMFLLKDFKWIERSLYLLATIVLMIVAPHWLDIPAYLTKNFQVVEGVPSEFDYKSPYKAGSYLQVKIRDAELKLPKSIPQTESDKWFVVHYLPKSKFIMEYKIQPKK